MTEDAAAPGPGAPPEIQEEADERKRRARAARKKANGAPTDLEALGEPGRRQDAEIKRGGRYVPAAHSTGGA